MKMYLEKMRWNEMFYVPAQGNAAPLSLLISAMRMTGSIRQGHGRIRTPDQPEKLGAALLFPVCAI
jgi:hypothetical protein